MVPLREGGGDWWLVMVRRSVLLVVLALVLVAAACGDRGGVSIWVSPSEVTLAPGETQEFTAGVQGARDALVEWSASGGELVASGVTAVFTAPAEVGEYTVTARSARDRGRWASATVRVESASSPTEEASVSMELGPDGGELELDSGVAVVVPGFGGDGVVRFTLSRLSVEDAIGVGLQAGATYELGAERVVGVESVTVRLPVVAMSQLEVPVVTYFVDGVPERVEPALVDGAWVVDVPVGVGADVPASSGVASQGVERGSFDWRVVFGFSRVVPVVYVFGDGRQVMGEARTNPCFDSRTMEDLSCFVFFDDDGVVVDTSDVGVPDAILAVERDDGKEQFAFIVDVAKDLLSTFLVAYEFAGSAGAAGTVLLASVSQPIWQLQFASAAQSAVIRWFGQFNPNLTDYLTFSAQRVDFMSAASDWGVELTSSFVLTVPKFNTRCPYSFCNILQVQVEDAFDAGSVSYRDVWFWLHESTSDELFVLKAADQSLDELVGEVVGAEANFCRSRPGGIEAAQCGNSELRLVAVGLVDRGWWGLGSDRIVRMLVNTDAFAVGDVSPRQAPEIELVGPDEPDVSFAWTVSADHSIDSVQFRFNDEEWESASADDGVTRILASGLHTFELMAVDAVGLRSTEAREFSVDGADVPRVSVEPSSVTLLVNGTQSFTATVTGVSDTSVTWDASCGSITGGGNTVEYTAPATAGSCDVTASSVEVPESVTTVVVEVVDEDTSSSLRYGQNYEGQVSSTEPVELTFQGASGDVVSVSLRHPRVSGTTATVVLESPTGERLYSGTTVSLNYPWAGRVTSGPVELVEDGRYSVWVTSNGSLDFEVGLAAIGEPVLIALGDEVAAVEGAHEVLGDVQYFRISVPPGAMLNLHHRSAPDSGWWGEMQVHEADGGPFHSRPALRTVRNSSFLRDAEYHSQPMYFEHGGEYLVSIRADRHVRAQLGEWILVISRPPEVATALPAMLEGTIERAGSRFYSFDGRVGDVVSVSLSHPPRTNLTATLAVYAPQGDRLYIGTTRVRENVRSTGPLTIEVGGRYVVWVTSNGTTDYIVELVEVIDD